MQDVLKRHLALQERNLVPPVSALMIDLDHFKQINDNYGHGAGDRVLEQVAELVTAACRSADVPVRYGGEEFLVLVIGQGLDGAVTLAERLHRLIEQRPVEIGRDEPLRVTASLGVAERRPSEEIDSLIHRADMALYRAKRAGRNRYQIADEDSTPDSTEARQAGSALPEQGTPASAPA
jgi:diguanylate cyclase (GGDEF)-like protein